MRTRDFYILITIVITLCLHSACAEARPEASSVKKVSPEELKAIKVRAETFFAQRAEISKLREAISLLEKARDPNERNFTLESNLARYSYFLGRHSSDNAEAETAFENGKKAGQIAANMSPDSPEGHFWYGANLGELCKRNPVTVGLRSVEDVRDAMNRVISISPGYQGAAAFDALAQIELGTASTGGSPQKALELLEKGFEMDKQNSNILLRMAEAHLALKNEKDAGRYLDILLKMPPHPDYEPEHRQSVEAAKKLLANRF